MLEYVLIVILVALFAAWVRIVMNKWGITEWCLVNLPELLAKLVECTFCSAFWLATIIGVILAICTYGTVDYPGLYIFIGVFVAPIARLLA